MKFQVTLFISMLMFLSSECSDFLEEYADFKPLWEALKTCDQQVYPRKPVVAMQPSALAKLMGHMIIFDDRLRNDSPTKCIEKGVQQTDYDPSSWNFCLFGYCEPPANRLCVCQSEFKGTNCDRYELPCWIMYCYAGDCKNPQSRYLECRCNQKLWGTGVSSGLFVYESHIASKFEPPPPNWGTESSNMESMPMRVNIKFMDAVEAAGGRRAKTKGDEKSPSRSGDEKSHPASGDEKSHPASGDENEDVDESLDELEDSSAHRAVALRIFTCVSVALTSL